MERGWVEGKNLVLDFRSADNRYDRLPALATELVTLKPDAIFAVAAPAIRAAMQATSTIPIVIEMLGDAQGAGFVADLARPGGNVTGVSGFAPELINKRVQLIRPSDLDRFQRVAVYVDRILRSAKPFELPVERPTKFEMVINLKAAKALRLAIPQSVLLQADQVIQ